jgi:FG-GAP-like repeat/ASPIC and UnbV
MRVRRMGLTLALFLAVLAIGASAVLPGVSTAYLGFMKPSAGDRLRGRSADKVSPGSPIKVATGYRPRQTVFDTSGFDFVRTLMDPWKGDDSLEVIARSWDRAGYRAAERMTTQLEDARGDDQKLIPLLFMRAAFMNYEGEAAQAYQILDELRSMVSRSERRARDASGTLDFFQGVTAMRIGENENCIMCRGESSCILPIAAAAIHTKPDGSRRAIKHFTDYLTRFPDDVGVRWLLNLAHMTLGEYPDKVDPRYRLDLGRYFHSEFDIGKFRDVGHLVGVNRFNQAGGAIMEDFDNDGLLDLAVTSWDPTQPMAYYRNAGDGTFEDRSSKAGISDQLGGLVCYQADYDNDGLMDIFIPRGAWLHWPIRPSLLRNAGAGVFKDVTRDAGLLDPGNSHTASWGDYDNDGWLDLFMGCEKQTNRLYHNRGNGTFEEVAAKAGVQGDKSLFCKGSAWIDYDNDNYPDLYLNNLNDVGRLYHNDRDGRFTEVTTSMGIDGPREGFSCWAWDFDNDGWLDIFGNCADRTLNGVVQGILGQPDGLHHGRLYRNRRGEGFDDMTTEAGLDMAFAPMGSNFADFDNDGWLDFYLATGEPSLATLVPNRMFKNVDGKRFAEITASSGTGHLQKGHAVACGDWDRDGDVDMFVETGGATNGDRYHNVLFQNPGQGNHSLTVKLVGKKTNRAAIGARIKVVTAGETPLTVHRHVTSGSSFGANTLQQTIGLAKAQQVATLEIHWPTSNTTQVFRNISADQAIEVTEFADSFRPLNWTPLPQPR